MQSGSLKSVKSLSAGYYSKENLVACSHGTCHVCSEATFWLMLIILSLFHIMGISHWNAA